MNRDSLKRKLRSLKRFEIRTRFGENTPPKGAAFVWDELFNDKPDSIKQVKYPFDILIGMDRDEIKSVFDIFFSMVYYRYYEENGIFFDIYYDARLLEALGLAYDSTEGDVKNRFRLLAKRYHPDAGGDSAKFIELMDIYNSLLRR